MSIFGAIAAGVTSIASKAAFVITPYAPVICLGGGLALGAGAIISACKDTLSADEILAEDEKRMEAIKKAMEVSKREVEAARVEGRAVNQKLYYSKKTMNINIFESKRTLTFKLACHFRRTIILALAAGALLIGGHYLLTAEIARLATANAGLMASLTMLRQNMGEEKYNQYMYGMAPQTTTATTMDENGQEETVEETQNVGVDPTQLGCSVYAQPFFVVNPNFDPNDPEGQVNFIKDTERMMDNQLHQVGHLYLNTVYDKFAFERTELGHDHGWTWKPGEDKHVNFIVTPFTYVDPEGVVREAYMIDFNCDGDIKHKLCTSKSIGDGVGKSLRYASNPTVAVA